MGGLACGLALLAVACGSSGPATGGPFNGKGSNLIETVCDSTPPGGVVYDGIDAFQNTGGTATIGRVVLVDARHLRLLAAWVVPKPRSSTLIGVGRGYPSASGLASTTLGNQWWRRQRLPGAVVGHTRGRDLINIVLVVKPSGDVVGTARAFDLYYQAGGTHYRLRFLHGLKIWIGRSGSC
jgi:hypothetical protein